MSPTSRPSVIFGHTFAKLRVSSLALVLCIVSAVNVAFAAPASFDIPAQPAPAALDLFMKQSGTKVLFSNDDLKSVTTNPVAGQMEALTALKKLVKGTGFQASQTDGSSFIVSREKVGAGTVQGSLALPDGHPAMDAIVTVYETGQSANADREGRFTLAGVSAGTHVLVITSPECQTLHITDVHVRAEEELTLAKETLRKADDVAKMEPYEISAQTIEQMEKYIVTDTNAKPPAFTDRNMDISRTIDDVQPYYIFDSSTIEQSGTTNVEDFLKNMLTMNTLAQTNSQQYGGNGTLSTINLRGLGSNQTLILVDGRRTAGVSIPGELQDFQSDINGIPLNAIDRIEVLPSSASAIYGGSAVGGVVNIILKSDYQGGEIKVTYDTPFNADAPLRTVDGSYGFSADHGKTHVMINAHYSDGKFLVEGERQDLIERGIETILRNDPSLLYSPNNPFQGATTNIASGQSYFPVPAGTPGAYGPFSPGTFYSGYSTAPTTVADPDLLIETPLLTLKNGTSLNSLITYIPAGTSPSTSTSTLDAGLLQDAGRYNLAPSQGTGEYGLQNAVEKVPRVKSLMATIHQELASSLELFAEASTSSNIGLARLNFIFPFSEQIASSAPDNPFEGNVVVTIPTALSGSAVSDSVNRSITMGMIAKLPADWRAELDYTWSQNAYDSIYDTNDSTAVSKALNSGAVNPFVDTLAYPLDVSSYLRANYSTGDSTLDDLTLRASGPLFSLPWGKPTLTVGLEHRKEGDDNARYINPYPLTPSNSFDNIFFGQNESTDSGYLEAEIPIVTSKNAFLGVQSLELQAAVRSERYSVGSGTQGITIYPNDPSQNQYDSTPGVHTETKFTSTNPTVGIRYSPLHGVTLRASYATAFLPPTYYQLVNNPVLQPSYGQTVYDPKTGQTYSSYETVQNQNSDLKPQNSKDWDVGIVWEPKGDLLKGLRFDLEFFQIKEFNAITSAPSNQFIVDGYPNRITRDPTTGLITVIDTSSVNLYELETEGYDLSFDYRKTTPYGTFDMYAIGTVQEHYKQQESLNEPLLEYVGFPNEGGPAKIKANATLTWNWHQLSVGWTTRFFGSYNAANGPADPEFILYGYSFQPSYIQAQGSTTIPSQIYHDIFASYTFGKISDKHGKVVQSLGSNWTLQVGVKNVFNALPPFDANYSPFYYSPYGDPRLRDLWVSIKHDF